MKKRGWTKYGSKIRQKMVDEYLKTGLGYRDLEAKYGINYSTIAYWVKAERAEKKMKEAHKIKEIIGDCDES